MPLVIPTIDEVVNRSKTDVQRQVAGGIDPFNKNNVVTAITVANANRTFDFYIQLQAAVLECLPDTAVELLERWAAIFGVPRLEATPAVGNITATGTVLGTTIPIGTVFSSSDGETYTSNSSVDFEESTIATAIVQRTSNITTVTTATPHGFSNNTLISRIEGVTPASFNTPVPPPTLDIIIVNESKFTYDNNGLDDTATVQGLVRFQQASVPVDADNVGTAGNKPFGSIFTLQSPIANIDNQASTDFAGIAGGTNQESTEALRTRMLERIQNPVAHFNVFDIERKIKEINGITRVFVLETTLSTNLGVETLGAVTVFFMRDNDVTINNEPDPIPDPQEVAAAQAKLDEIRPANTSAVNAVVDPPTAVTQNFIIDALVPDTSTMRTAVEENLRAFFAEKTVVDGGATGPDGDVAKVAYDSAIFNTVDPETGQVVISFNVTTPAGAIVTAPGEIATLGTLGFT